MVIDRNKHNQNTKKYDIIKSYTITVIRNGYRITLFFQVKTLIRASKEKRLTKQTR